jgi:outer membrane lipoprotein carrier protein
MRDVPASKSLRSLIVVALFEAVLMVLTALPSARAAVAKEPVSKVLEGLQRYYHDTKSFHAKFVEVIAPVGAAKRTRTGIVYFRKPGRMRWEFEEPNKELIVSDGTQLYNYDPELNQVIEAPLSEALHSPGATEFLLGVGDISRDFNASLIDGSDADGLLHVKLIPKRPGNTVELGLEEKSYDIETIRMIDQLGNVTSLKLMDIEKNTPIADSTFAFTPPVGADIVRPSAAK